MTEIAAETIDVEDVETPPEQTFADLQKETQGVIDRDITPKL